MDYGHNSVLQGNKLFFNRVLSRDSSVSCSSRIYYCRNSDGVPFQWEMQPGTPKDPPKEEIIPPLSPPPAVVGLSLPKPCIIEQPKASTRPGLKFWKLIMKKNQASKDHAGSKRSNNAIAADLDKFGNLEFNSSDGEFMASPRNSSAPSISSALSFSNGHSFQSSRFEKSDRESTDWPYRCSPWNYASILVCVSRRV